MRSLSAHLREPESHGRLPFHPDCPVCRIERLSGSLPAQGVVPLRTQALLAAGCWRSRAARPGWRSAAEPDQEHDGSAAPGQSGASDPAQNPDFDPGGDTSHLPDAPGPSQPPATSDPDGNDAPVDPEPTTDADAPIVDPGDGSVASPGSQRHPTARLRRYPSSATHNGRGFRAAGGGTHACASRRAAIGSSCADRPWDA